MIPAPFCLLPCAFGVESCVPTHGSLMVGNLSDPRLWYVPTSPFPLVWLCRAISKYLAGEQIRIRGLR